MSGDGGTGTAIAKIALAAGLSALVLGWIVAVLIRLATGSATVATVTAAGKLSEALEIVEHARGLLYGFHRLCGSADLTLQEAVRALRDAGHPELADWLDQVGIAY